MGAILRAYTAAEQWADRGVHWLAMGGAVTGLIALLVVAGLSGDASPLVWTTLGVYGAGLVVMFGCSMLSNHAGICPEHAGIGWKKACQSTAGLRYTPGPADG